MSRPVAARAATAITTIPGQTLVAARFAEQATATTAALARMAAALEAADAAAIARAAWDLETAGDALAETGRGMRAAATRWLAR